MTAVPDSIGELARGVFDEHMGRFLEHSAGARAGNSTRDVHQMRVAARRLRAAVRLFGDILPPSEAGRFNDELKWVAGQIGQVRDLDVHLQRLQHAAVELDLTAELEPFGDLLAAERRTAREALTATLSSARFMDLVETFGTIRQWTLGQAAARPLEHEAAERLGQVFQLFDKRARRLEPSSPAAAFHAVRIRAKRLRYAVEFFAPALGKPGQTFAKRLASVQDLLGELQDTVVAADRMHHAVRTAGTTWPPQTNVALGQLIEHDAQRREVLKHQFVEGYEDVVGKAWGRLESNAPIS